jgi:hypothetical protein
MSLSVNLRLEGVHAETASTVGWIEVSGDGGPACLFCDAPARMFKAPATRERLWWCRPCETTWVA